MRGALYAELAVRSAWPSCRTQPAALAASQSACSATNHILTIFSSPAAIIVPHQIIWSWYTGCWWVGYYICYREKGPGRGCSPSRPLHAVPNVIAHPSMAAVPNTILLYNDPLLCGFNVPIKGLTVEMCMVMGTIGGNGSDNDYITGMGMGVGIKVWEWE